MIIRLFKSSLSENKQRCGVALLWCLGFTLLTLTPGSAQVRQQNRVTGLHLGEAPEGSRVTIVSDSALNDYEAFRRGDRFYVKVPQADSASPLPHLRANGFDDVQVQKQGDGLIVSFKLQPGASARVDQHANRLDVIFSSANRRLRNNSANTGNTQASTDRGPEPPGSVAALRNRSVTDRALDGSETRAPQNRWVTTPQSLNRGANDQSASGNAAVTSPLPVSSPYSAPTQGTSSSYSPLTSATPAAPSSRLVDSSSGSGGFLNWKHRGAAALRWGLANRLATLLGALILFSLMLYLVIALRKRRKTIVIAEPARTPDVQPKYSAADHLNELSSPSLNEQTSPGKDSAPARVGSEVISDRARLGEVRGQPDSREQQSARAAVASASTHEWVLTRPTITSPTAEADEYSSDQEDREVFEL
jgi:hypothetical protein